MQTHCFENLPQFAFVGLFPQDLIWMSQFWQDRCISATVFFSAGYTRRYLMSECVITVDVYLTTGKARGSALYLLHCISLP